MFFYKIALLKHYKVWAKLKNLDLLKLIIISVFLTATEVPKTMSPMFTLQFPPPIDSL